MRDPRDESLHTHRQWLGYLQPVGLVVSPPALVDSDCHVNTDVAEEYLRFVEGTADGRIVNLKQLLVDVFGWRPIDLVPADDPRVVELDVPLQNYGEILRPSFAVPGESGQPWVMLIQEVAPGLNIDSKGEEDGHKWHASPLARFERLLRETHIPVGLLCNAAELRLVYAPRGESLGYISFPVPVLLEPAGRLAFAALLMLLRESRVFGSTGGKTLAEVLTESRKYQNIVSTELAQQVLAALYELVRGIQAADAHRRGDLLREVLLKDPDSVYAGMLTVLLRLVFLLYAEDRGLMVEGEVYTRHYSVTGLFDKLRGDAGRHPDTMDQRYGAWAQLVSLFRIVHDGANSAAFEIPGRRGYLFDPDRYPFLEGRPFASKREPDELLAPPMISDGVVFRVLRNLMILDGERLSYRALDVEHIGSVYEAMMGFRVEVAVGASIAVKPKKRHGAAVALNLDELLNKKPADRAKYLKDQTDQAVTGDGLAKLKDAKTPEDVVAALERKVAKEVTPNIVSKGSVVLQPSEERRRSGSHYTPRALTEPIVRKALEPVLAALLPSPLAGEGLGVRGSQVPKPEQILALKICDPAMGSAAFLVETCRQLAELLVKSWTVHGGMPKIPPDEDELRHAQRLIAQRCLYGVDKNPMAVDLAKLSLWLTTLAKDHPFTFLDHALREGDALVGLSLKQIRLFHWDIDLGEKVQQVFGYDELERRVKNALALRTEILSAGDAGTNALIEQKFQSAEEALRSVRFAGNLVVAAFFSADKDKAREKQREAYSLAYNTYLQTQDIKLRPTKQAAALLAGDHPLKPFHWEIEFPEVFVRDNGGFDAMVGNPPFMGGSIVSTSLGMVYFDWLTIIYPPAGHLCDLVAYFFRRAFYLMRVGASLGFVATNTVAQGDTREGGLREIVKHGGVIYDVTKRYRWPGLAAVVVSIVHVAKQTKVQVRLDGSTVDRISCFLFAGGADQSPEKLASRGELWSVGTKVYGAGFLFEDGAEESTPIESMRGILTRHPEYKSVIQPYIGGVEINSHPSHDNSRFVINLNNIPDETGLNAWPELRDIILLKVKPSRDSLGSNPNNLPLKKRWWAFQGHRPDFYQAARKLRRVLAQSQVSGHMGFAFQPTDRIFANTLNLFLLDSFRAFAVLQSQTHESWARFFGSSMKDDLRYTASDCFETFPFPHDFESNAELETVGQEYYEFRAQLMVANNEGLTKTYNRFHDPHERKPEILKLRELHAAMDAAVLQAYGPPFSELAIPPCQFLLDYEDDEDEEETVGKRQKKKPWRFRWPDEFRDQVLALLLELNKERAALEGSATKTKKPRKAKKAVVEEGDLFG